MANPPPAPSTDPAETWNSRFEVDGFHFGTAPNTWLVLQGYTPKQLEYRTGGPRMASHLYTVEMLREAFADLKIVELRKYEAHLDEGAGHSGRSALVGLVARRPG